MELSDRQKKIIDIVKNSMPITGEQIADKLDLSRSTLRPDLSLLTLTEILIAKPKVGYLYNKNYVTPFIISDISQKKVEEVMSIPVIISKETSIQEGINQIFLEDSGSLYVTENGQLIGLVSRKDLLKSAIAVYSLDEIPISLAMTRMPNVVTINDKDTVENAARKLTLHKIDSLPVLKVNKKTNQHEIVGKFSKTVISNLFLKILDNEI